MVLVKVNQDLFSISMKLFNTIKNKIQNQEFLLFLFPILLIVPNVVFCFTEPVTYLSKLTNILLPLACYCFLFSLSTNIGKSILFFFPVIFFDAFQLVLLYLYGQSIIAVDMFLNVVTTNPGEVFELLGNLAIAIALVIVLYVPILTYAIILICKKKRLVSTIIPLYRKCSIIGIIAGFISLLGCYVSDKNYSISEELFPLNVCDNVGIAIKRTIKTNNYERTSENFRYNALSSHPIERKEIYVLVIGETGRAENWQLFGYNRPTNPHLSKQDGIIGFKNVLTESNTTHKSVPMLMSSVNAENFDSIYYRKGIITAFKEAGFHTSFYSNHKRNRSFIDYLGNEANHVEYLSDDSNSQNFDLQLADKLNQELKDNKSKKSFIVLHSYGSHFNYKERYPSKIAKFKPDNVIDASSSYRTELINAYDNTIVYTDYFLSEVINHLNNVSDADVAMIYISDHGEDIFDDSRNRFLHASPIPTYYQLHVPMVLWMSKNYRNSYPELWNTATINKSKAISSSKSTFHTILQIAGIETQYYNPTMSLTDSAYIAPKRVYLSDRNEELQMNDAGMNFRDYNLLRDKNLFHE